MKWFRHFSNASTSLKLNELIDKLGIKGYGQYWLLVELLNEKFDGLDASSIKVHQSELLTSLRLRYVGTLGELLGNMKGLELLDYTRDERVYSFNCPMLFELMDKDSKYNRKNHRKGIAPSEQDANNRYKNKDLEEELDKDNSSPTPSLIFDPSKYLNAKKILPDETPQENLKEVSPKFTPDHFVDVWNELLGKRLKYMVSLGGGIHRDNFLKSLEFLPTEKHWRDLLETCINTPKLMGQNDIEWAITPTWIVNYDNAIKVLNGDFEDGKHIKNLFAGMTSGEAV